MYPILVVLTGGTIGSVCTDGVRQVRHDSPYLLLRQFRHQCPVYEPCTFEVINPYSILSENLSPACWESLYAALSRIDLSRYQGIIITHGSDTLAYTAAAMGYLLRHTPIPIVLIASDRPPDDPRSNAVANLRSAVEFILHSGLHGVFAAYQKNTGRREHAIYAATRLCSADNFLDDFSSYGGGCLGETRDGRFLPCDLPVNPPLTEWNRSLSPVTQGELHLDRSVMLLRSYPGMDYAAIEPQGFAAVVHYGYHSATACTEGGRRSLIAFAERCAGTGTDVWLGAFKRTEKELYASNDALLQCGIKPFYDMSPEAAYAKAVLAYNLPDTPPDAFMERNVYFEQIGQPLTWL